MGFETILEHDDLKERLGRLVLSPRLGNAYLFLGPPGVGRKMVAIAWAQALNCLEQPGRYPYACGACRSCRKILSRQFPDLFIVEPEEGKTLKIEQMREILRESHFKPFEGKKRVFIIDGADSLTDGAANSLLKTLEEPPETLILILIAEHEGQILPTIRSRCQFVRFGSIPLNTVVQELVKRGAHETQARWLAYEAAGSLGRAEAALADVKESKEIRQALFDAIKTLGQPGAAFRIAEQYKKPEDAVPAIRVLKAYYRDAVVLKSGRQDKVVNSDFMAEIRAEADAHDLPDLVDRFAAVEEAERRIDDFNANRQLVLERLLQELSH